MTLGNMTLGNAALGILAGLALMLAGCGGDDGDDSAGSTTSSPSSSTSTTGTTAGSTSSVVASTASTTATTGSTTTTEDPTTTTVVSTTATTQASNTTEILVIEGGVHAFTSPSGNIACVMDAFTASCWIGERSWTIEQPSAPECEESDWGNAVDLSADGPSFPCYTDFGWNPSAPAMAYGTSVELGPFRCDSAETGVTCTNASGNGFTVAKAAVSLF